MIPRTTMMNLVSKKVFHSPTCLGSVVIRCVSSDSWAAARLAEQGVKLESAKHPLTLCTLDMLKNTPPKIQKLSEEILSMNAMEVHQLLSAIQFKLGFQDDVLYGSGGSSNESTTVVTEKVEEKVVAKESFDIKLGAVDAASKIKVIKEVRAITGLGLKEAKELVEKAPIVIKQGLKKEDADGFLKLLSVAGAAAELV